MTGAGVTLSQWAKGLLASEGILRGVYPEPVGILRCAQNDKAKGSE